MQLPLLSRCLANVEQQYSVNKNLQYLCGRKASASRIVPHSHAQYQVPILQLVPPAKYDTVLTGHLIDDYCSVPRFCVQYAASGLGASARGKCIPRRRPTERMVLEDYCTVANKDNCQSHFGRFKDRVATIAHRPSDKARPNPECSCSRIGEHGPCAG